VSFFATRLAKDRAEVVWDAIACYPGSGLSRMLETGWLLQHPAKCRVSRCSGGARLLSMLQGSSARKHYRTSNFRDKDSARSSVPGFVALPHVETIGLNVKADNTSAMLLHQAGL